jgi:hypothetical protein
MGRSSREDRYWAFALLAGFALFGMAQVNQLTFPFPSLDDARFYLPALWVAKYGSLNPTVLNAPRGIFWVPDGLTVLLGLVMRLFGQSIEVARIACECMVAAGVALFALVFRRLSGSAATGALATLLLLTPPVVFAANSVRMEAPVFLLIALALLLHLNDHFLGAGALLFGSLLIHPALGLAAAGYTMLSWEFRPRRAHSSRGRIFDWVILAAVLLCWLLEGVHIARHVDLFSAHMAYQVGHKMRLSLTARLFKPQGVILFLTVAATVTIMIRRMVWKSLRINQYFLGAAVIALGVQTYSVLCAELSYDIYDLSLAPAIIFCLVVNEFRVESPEPVLDPAYGKSSKI